MQIAQRPLHADLAILDELNWLPFSQNGEALRFHLISKLYEKTSRESKARKPNSI